MKKCIVLFAMFMLFGSMALAITVGPTGDYATIEDAISSICPGGANAGGTPPFVIEIDPTVAYEESLTLNDGDTSGAIVGDLVMKSATPGTKAVIKLKEGISGGGDGIQIYQSVYNVDFTDILFCPSITGWAYYDDMIKIDENTTSASIANTIEFYDCIFSDVDAAGDPMVISKQDIIDMDYPSSITAYVSGSGLSSGDMLLKWWGDSGENISGKLINCGFFCRGGYNARIVLDGTSGETFEIKDCLFAGGTDDNAAFESSPNKVGSSVLIHGTTDPCAGNLDKCTAILSSGEHGIKCDYYTVAGANIDIKNVLIDIDDIWGTNDACPIYGGNGDIYVEDVIINVRTNPYDIVDYPTNVTTPETFKRMTLHLEGASTPWLYTGSLPDPGGFEFIDCVFSGNAMGAYTSPGPPAQGVKVINSVIATSGADAITTMGVVAEFINCKLIDPAYVSKDRKVEGYMDPTDSSLLFAGLDHIDNAFGQGVSLGGGGDYSGGPDASDIANNVFKAWGDCEGDIFTTSSARGNFQGAAMAEVQRQARGVNGLGLMLNYTWGRFEGATDTEDISGFTDGGEELSFYFKSPTQMYSYPRFGIQLDRNPWGGSGETGDCAEFIEWQNTYLECDGIWHLYRPDISTLDFNGKSTANICTNNYAVPEQYLDEIVLVDTAEEITNVQEWGLF